MSDLISRKDAIEWVQNILATHLYYHPHSKSRNVPIDEVIDSLERVPSVEAVPVVRCKDCKIRYTDSCGMFDVEAEWEWTEDNGFCQYGERREK